MVLTGREAFCDELAKAGAQDERVVCLETLWGGTGHPFEAAHPERFFALYAAEAAMVQMARGLAVAGFRPFATLVAPEATVGAKENLRLTLDYLEAGASVLAPYGRPPEDLLALRALAGVTVAAPYGEAEMRAVVRAAARSGRPHYIQTGRDTRYASPGWPGPELPLLNWVVAGEPDVPCLLSVGEPGAELALRAGEEVPGTAHARLVYVDDAHLAAAAAELALRHRVFVVVGDMGPGGVAQALAPLLAGCVVTGVRVEEGMAGVLAAAGVDRVGG
ncbi:transketolase [Streptomyces sp. NBC_01304]|uniref:transketolase n=1 Tax=Streptomyces sp. NBC_01304 TaxID=2903818 RepID=UPI002E10B9CE|nr:transketolase [Streptomyces sp. NBC_01304]